MSFPKLNVKLSLETMETRLVPASLAPGLFINNQGMLSFNGGVNDENKIWVQEYGKGIIGVAGTLGGLKVRQEFAPGKVKSLNFIGGNKDDYFRNDTRLPSTAMGYAGADTFSGGSSVDSFYGGNGKDSISGGAGNDYLDGGDQDDGVFGGDGKDWCIGGKGKDGIFGGANNDILIGGTFDRNTRRYAHDGERDSLEGDGGADTFVAEWYVSYGTRWNRDLGPRMSDGDKYDNP